MVKHGKCKLRWCIRVPPASYGYAVILAAVVRHRSCRCRVRNSGQRWSKQLIELPLQKKVTWTPFPVQTYPRMSGSNLEIKTLQKSNTFSSLATGGQKLGTWFDRRARKISMRCSKSLTLGDWLIFLPLVRFLVCLPVWYMYVYG